MYEAKTTWGAGEYALMARALEPASARVVDAVNVSAGERVMDIATGTGNAALMAAARGAHVLGIDTEPALLALARQRASADLDVKWLELLLERRRGRGRAGRWKGPVGHPQVAGTVFPIPIAAPPEAPPSDPAQRLKVKNGRRAADPCGVLSGFVSGLAPGSVVNGRGDESGDVKCPS